MKAEASDLAVPPVSVPAYLAQTYWWAYVHPQAVRVFERQWLVNLILWENFNKLRNAALAALGHDLSGRTLQIACVYGDLTQRLAERIPANGSLDVVDVLPVQLANPAKKLPSDAKVGLLHEQPEAIRRKTLAEALRVIKPGGRLVIVDYHSPAGSNPLFWPMKVVLET